MTDEKVTESIKNKENSGFSGIFPLYNLDRTDIYLDALAL
jgi:hypothetical protein